jgi:hypothetical protein
MNKKLSLQQHYPQMKHLDTTTYLREKKIVVLSIRPPCSIATSTNFHLPKQNCCPNFALCQQIKTSTRWIQTIVHKNHLQGLKFVVHIEVEGYFFQHLKKWGDNICKVTCMATHSNVLHEEIRLLSSIFFFPLKN